MGAIELPCSIISVRYSLFLIPCSLFLAAAALSLTSGEPVTIYHRSRQVGDHALAQIMVFWESFASIKISKKLYTIFVHDFKSCPKIVYKKSANCGSENSMLNSNALATVISSFLKRKSRT